MSVAAFRLEPPSGAPHCRCGTRLRRSNQRRCKTCWAAYIKTPSGRVESLPESAKKRATHRRQPFAITVADLSPAPLVCPVLGMRLSYDGKGERAAWASIDRIVPVLGYVPGNVAIMSWRANRLKGDGSPEEMEALARYMANFTRGTPWR